MVDISSPRLLLDRDGKLCCLGTITGGLVLPPLVQCIKKRRRTPFNRREKGERKKHLYRALPLFFRRHPPCARVCVSPSQRVKGPDLLLLRPSHHPDFCLFHLL